MHLFALKTLFVNRGKLVTALVGVVFSLVLANVQGGLYFGLIGRANVLIDVAGADIWVGHRLLENVDLPHEIPLDRIARIKALPEVAQAEPLVVGRTIARLNDGGYEDVWLIGCEPKSLLGAPTSYVAGSAEHIRSGGRISIDVIDERKLSFPSIGETIEIGGQRAEIVAKTRGLLGFMTIPILFTNADAARRYSHMPVDRCSYYLVQLRPGVNPELAAARIQERLPDFDVLTAKQFRRISEDYWMKRTGIGVSFGAATLLGLLVGLVMVTQSLYALALDHVEDYAALKAIGASASTLFGVVVVQALFIASVGSVVGLFVVALTAEFCSSPLAPINIPPGLLYGSVGLVFGICLFAALLPVLRIRTIDPAIVLQG